MGPASTHRYVSGGLTIGSLAESIAVLAIEADKIMQVVSLQATYEKGQNWMSFGSIIHHLLMLPINLAQLIMILLIDPTAVAY